MFTFIEWDSLASLALEVGLSLLIFIIIIWVVRRVNAQSPPPQPIQSRQSRSPEPDIIAPPGTNNSGGPMQSPEPLTTERKKNA